MKKRLLFAAIACLAFGVEAKTITANAYAPGPDQPTSCTSDFSGRALPCLLRPNANPGELYPYVDFSSLPAGTYSVVITVSNINLGACTGGPVTFTCAGGGGTNSSDPIIVIVNPPNSTPAKPQTLKVFP